MTLTMTNEAPVYVPAEEYVRIGFTDGEGEVSGFFRKTNVHYRIKGGTPAEKRDRAVRLAAELGGTVYGNVNGTGAATHVGTTPDLDGTIFEVHVRYRSLAEHVAKGAVA